MRDWQVQIKNALKEIRRICPHVTARKGQLEYKLRMEVNSRGPRGSRLHDGPQLDVSPDELAGTPLRFAACVFASLGGCLEQALATFSTSCVVLVSYKRRRLWRRQSIPSES